jgi:hypothetical protein
MERRWTREYVTLRCYAVEMMKHSVYEQDEKAWVITAGCFLL